MLELIERPIDHMVEIIRHCIKLGINFHLLGGSGIGKTTSIEAAARESGRLLCTHILAAMDVPDIGMATLDKDDPRFIAMRVNKGLPFIGTEDRWLHPETGLPPVLFFDEANNMLPFMMAVMQQAFLTKSIHGVPFIPGTVIAAASNRVQDAAGVSKMTGPFANRQIFLNCLPPTMDGFIAWCIKNDINPWIASYAQHTGGEMIYEWDPAKFLAEPAFSTPRAWATTVATILDNDAIISADDRVTMIAGQVGRARAEDFETYYRMKPQLPDIEKVRLTGEGLVPKDMAVKVMVINSLVRIADHKCVGNLFKYISKLSVGDPEYGDLFEKTLFKKDPTFAGHPAYTKWVLDNQRQPLIAPPPQPTTPTPTTTDIKDLLRQQIQPTTVTPKRRI